MAGSKPLLYPLLAPTSEGRDVKYFSRTLAFSIPIKMASLHTLVKA